MQYSKLRRNRNPSQKRGRSWEQTSGLNTSSWTAMGTLLKTHKAGRAGRRVVFVKPPYTSRTCSRCEFVIDELSLSDRVFACPKCGLRLERDLNASFNILKRGLDEGLGRPGLPVEGGPLPRIVPYRADITGQVFLMKQETLPVRVG